MINSLYPRQYLYRQIVQAKLFIDKNFAEKIDLNNISDEACFSKFHFIRLYKQIYGCTPHQYLIAVRIEKAKLLLQQNKTIASVCFSVGFDSISSFTGLFKKRVGLTPSQYQRKMRQTKLAIAKNPLLFIPNCFAENNGWVKKQF